MRLTMTACVVTVLSCLMSHVAQGALISEDFSYTAGNLNGKVGGVGWSAAWGNGDTGTLTSAIVVANENLTYVIDNGYNITQTGTGRVGSSSNSLRVINRPLDDPLSGTIWFSYLFVNTNGSSTSKAGLTFNTTEQLGSIQYGIMVNATSTAASNQARLILNGVETNFTQSLSNGPVRLAVGRIVTGAGTGSFDLWIDPADLNNLPVSPNVSVSDITFPDITRIGVILQGSSGGAGQLDALRVSNTSTAFADVTGVPEPAPLALLVVGASLLSFRRRGGDHRAHQAR